MDRHRVWIYCRVAHKDDRAIMAQKLRLEEYADTHGFSVMGVSVEQASGTTLDRPGLSEVTAAVNNGTADVILVLGLDRICRDCFEACRYVEFLTQHGVSLVTLREGHVDVGLFSITKVLMSQGKRQLPLA